ERHERVPPQRGQHLVIVGDGIGIDAPLFGLDAAPLEREPMRVVPVALGEGEVLVEQVPVPAGIAAPRAVEDRAGLLLEPPPVVEAIAAFDLMGRSRCAPQKAVREAPRERRHRVPRGPWLTSSTLASPPASFLRSILAGYAVPIVRRA